MWIRVDVEFVQHPKVIAAAAHFARGGCARVVAVWLEALSYAARHATDGFVPRKAAQHFATDWQPVRVLDVMSGGDVRLLVKFTTGYQIHDYADYQLSASQVKTGRGRTTKPTPHSLWKTSSRTVELSTACAKLNGSTTAQPLHSWDERLHTTGRIGQNAPETEFCTAVSAIEQYSTEDQDQDQARAAPTLARRNLDAALLSTRVARRHLLKSAHAVLDLTPDAADSELSDAVKDAAGQLHCAYDSTIVSAIVRAARAQRGTS